MDPPKLPRLLATPDDGRRAPVPTGQVSGLVMRHGSMELRWHAPGTTDPQTPHDRDELYVVASGTAIFVRAEEGIPFADDRQPPLRGEDDRVAMVEALANGTIDIIVSSHDPQDVDALAQSVIHIDNGRVVDPTPTAAR